MSIAQVLKEVMIETNTPVVWYGDPDILHVVANRSGIYDRSKDHHPLSIFQRVLNAAERSHLFDKGYIKHAGRQYRSFQLKSDEEIENESRV